MGKGTGSGEGAGEGVGSGLMRCFLVVVNIFFGLFGFVLLAGGAFIKLGESLYMPFVNDIIASIPSFSSGAGLSGASSPADDLTASFDLILGGLSIGLIVLGLFLFITAILGCISSCCQVKCVMIIYCIILIVLLIGQLVFVILFATGFFDNMIKGQMETMLENKYVGLDHFGAESLLLNVVMIQFKCCGVNNYKDFATATKWNNKRDVTVTYQGQSITQEITLMTPIACCKTEGSFPAISLPDETCAVAATPLNNNMNMGCFDNLMGQLDTFRTPILGALGGLLGFQALMVVFVITLIVLKNNEKVEVV